MKKTYIAPEMIIMEIETNIMNASIDVDPTVTTPSQYSRQSYLDFEDDEELEASADNKWYD